MLVIIINPKVLDVQKLEYEYKYLHVFIVALF